MFIYAGERRRIVDERGEREDGYVMFTAKLVRLAEHLLNLLVVLMIPIYLCLAHQNRDVSAEELSKYRNEEEEQRERKGSDVGDQEEEGREFRRTYFSNASS